MSNDPTDLKLEKRYIFLIDNINVRVYIYRYVFKAAFPGNTIRYKQLITNTILEHNPP